MKPTRLWGPREGAKASVGSGSLTMGPIKQGTPVTVHRLHSHLSKGHLANFRLGAWVRYQRIVFSMEFRWPEFYTTSGEQWLVGAGYPDTSIAFGTKRRADVWIALARYREDQSGYKEAKLAEVLHRGTASLYQVNVRSPMLGIGISPGEEDWEIMCSHRVEAPQDGFFRETFSTWPAPADPDPIRWSTHGWEARRKTATLVWEGDVRSFFSEATHRGDQGWAILIGHAERWPEVAVQNWIVPEEVHYVTRVEFIDESEGF